MIVTIQIPKCASTSAKTIFQKRFRGEWSGVVGNTAEQAADMFFSEVERRKDTPFNRPIRAISGHMPYGIHQYIDGYIESSVEYVVTSRNPLDRVISLWKFTYGKYSNHRLSLTEWLEVIGSAAHNVLTRYMSGKAVDNSWVGDSNLFNQVEPVMIEPLLSEDLTTATENIDRCSVVGVVDRFLTFQQTIENRYNLPNVPEYILNSFQDSPATAAIENYVPTSREINRILELNDMDVVLHNYIANEVAP